MSWTSIFHILFVIAWITLIIYAYKQYKKLNSEETFTNGILCGLWLLTSIIWCLEEFGLFNLN